MIQSHIICVIVISPIHSKCPPNVTADFEVIFNDGEDSSTAKGCASLEFKSRNNFNEMNIFGLKFGRFNSDGPRVCVPGTLNNLLFYYSAIYFTAI